MSALMSALMRVCELIGFLLWLSFCCLLLGLAGGGLSCSHQRKRQSRSKKRLLPSKVCVDACATRDNTQGNNNAKLALVSALTLDCGAASFANRG